MKVLILKLQLYFQKQFHKAIPHNRARKTVSWIVIAGLAGYWVLAAASPAQAMHIMEGFLPLEWAVAWWLAFLPFFLWGLRSINRVTREHPETKLLLALAGAFTFVLSALKMPSVTGSCSHPTGTGLGAVLFGPAAMSVLGSLVLLFQAVLLAHGGLTTLGANAFSMAVVGPLAAFGLYRLVMRWTGRQSLAIFLASSCADLLTYVVTAAQLALAFPAASGGFGAAFLKFAGIFAVTQVPLAIAEGFLTVVVWNGLQAYNQEELKLLNLIKT